MAVDVQGRHFAVGQQVAKAAKFFQVDGLHVVICKVTKVVDEKVYLDDSNRPLRFPDRVAIM